MFQKVHVLLSTMISCVLLICFTEIKNENYTVKMLITYKNFDFFHSVVKVKCKCYSKTREGELSGTMASCFLSEEQTHEAIDFDFWCAG